MALLDHFHPPLSTHRHWHAFHNAWATYIASELNQRLPQGYFAEPNVQYGIEIDVATFDETPASDRTHSIIAFPSQQPDWQPPTPTETTTFQPTLESVEVSIFNQEAGPTLTGAIELVSPANKDRASHRDAFTAKCQTYLQRGIGLMVVDIVTNRSANLHAELMQRLQPDRATAWGSPLSAIAYQVVEAAGDYRLSIWQEALSLGQALPVLPLWLGQFCLPVDLNATYDRTYREQRIQADSA